MCNKRKINPRQSIYFQTQRYTRKFSFLRPHPISVIKADTVSENEERPGTDHPQPGSTAPSGPPRPIVGHTSRRGEISGGQSRVSQELFIMDSDSTKRDKRGAINVVVVVRKERSA